ncbi:hypothetical protein CDAR_377091 [Caerostris darwini]|uniref:Uncharacterized protein n=1 Tax=Caerostris darwini TaxID=1538125 RepID=A0AAV4UQN8_9ARAC|nr:hypothetical protein CDAR_377091 [Caerostris darwini]
MASLGSRYLNLSFACEDAIALAQSWRIGFRKGLMSLFKYLDFLSVWDEKRGFIWRLLMAGRKRPLAAKGIFLDVLVINGAMASLGSLYSNLSFACEDAIALAQSWHMGLERGLCPYSNIRISFQSGMKSGGFIGDSLWLVGVRIAEFLDY